MPVINGVYTKDFPALGRAPIDADIIPIAEVANQITYKTTIGAIFNAKLSGTSGRLSKFTSANTLGNSILNEIGNAIHLTNSGSSFASFGIINPGTPGDPGVDNDCFIGSTINNDFTIRVNNTEAARFDTALRFKIANIPNADTDTNKFLVSDNGTVKYRTGAELLSDIGAGTGSVTSVGLTMPSAFSVANSPVTSSGTLAVTAIGLASQYIRGDGQLADFPTGGGGGGSSVSYYLNGSVNQGTFGGNVYKEMNKVPIFGAGTDFTINADGYIAQFLTDANDPNLLLIPAGNWNFETYFSASSGGGSPSFYVELYKYNGSTFSLIASSSATPELIAFGTNINPYFSSLAVPETVLLATDRLAIRIYVNTSGRTITLHTENSHLCQIITTFTTGLQSLNGLTEQTQYFAVGSTGTDFNIASSVDTHTFNIPSASAANRGLITTGTQTIAGAKTFQATATFNVTGNPSINAVNGDNLAISAESGTATAIQAISNSGRGIKAESTSNLAADLISNSGVGLSVTSLSNTIANFYGASFALKASISQAGNITANSFIKSGGTSSQFLKADGSIDSNTYALASALSAYVPYTGATSLVNLGIYNLKANSLYAEGDGSSTGGGLLIKQYVSGTTSITGYNTISSQTSGFFFSASQGGSYKNFLFDATSLTDLTVRSYTLPNASGTLALTSNLNAYLPLSGGTLTGALGGTSASFSSSVTANRYIINGTNGNSGQIIQQGDLLGTAGTNLLFQSSTGNGLGFLTNGTTDFRMFINSSGNVGIGTTSPTSKFEVVDGTGSVFRAVNSGTNIMEIGNYKAGGAGYQQLDIVSSIVTFGTGTAGGGSATERMRITSGGNVGIGTTSPGAKLDVLGTTQFGRFNLNSPSVFHTNNTSSTPAITAFKNTEDGAANVLLIQSFFGGASVVDVASIKANGAATFSSSVTANSYSINSNGTIASNGFWGTLHTKGAGSYADWSLINSGGSGIMWNPTGTINMSFGGNVGIGTTSPTAALTVSGTNVGAAIDWTNTTASTGRNFRWVSLNTGGFAIEDITAGSERMRITSGGNVLIGTTSNDFVSRQVNLSATSYTLHSIRTGTGSEGHLLFSNANGAVGSIFTDGSSTSYNTSSDYRLKQDLKDYNGIDLISKIKTYDYEWKSDNTRSFGVLAHELQEIIPYAVTGEKDAKEMQSVDYSKLVPVLVKAIQEQQAQIEELKALINK